MAGEKQEAPWPVPSGHFKVTFGGNLGEIAFQLVSGLKTSYETLEYRAGNSIEFSNVSMPFMRKNYEVILRKGMFVSDGSLMQYFASVKMNTIERQTVTIQLLNEEHSPIFTWTLKNAYPKAVAFGDMDAMNPAIMIEELILAHEGLSMEAN